jgi:hypothetical protein
MNTRPYTDLLGLVEALCGATLAEQERVRIRYFVNRRAQRAYAATELWPRFLVVGEERVVSEAGLLPYEQPALADIGTVLRIHATRPFLSDPAREYGEFYASTAGIQITGYQPAQVESLYSAFITYKAALAATYGSNDGDTTDVPEEWFEYAAHGAYADFLRNEGQQEKALVAEAEATEILQEQLEKVSRQGGARVATRVMNHANHQSR